ncbi:MAG: hypothetical protein ACJ786_19730 [Catenulispora sp.]
MDLTVLSYVIYLLISVVLTVWVARTLSRAGRVFLAQVFPDSEQLPEAVNHLLVVGFYLVNLGFVSLYLKSATSADTARQVFEELSIKEGVVLLVLGGMHLGNVFVLNKLRSNSRRDHSVPPIPPTGFLTGPDL